MREPFKTIMDWSEVWAPLIPLLVLLYKKKQPRFLNPVIIYLLIALLFNLAGDIIDVVKQSLPSWLQSNNPLYDIHSIARFLCFSYFFFILPYHSSLYFKITIFTAWILIILINFFFIESFGNPSHLSGNLLAAEAYLLLAYCMQFYLSKLKNDDDDVSSGADFWIVTGLAIYVVINFFVFLFYVPMLDQNVRLAINIWNIHNAAYILFCLFITKAFYEPSRYQYSI